MEWIEAKSILQNVKYGDSWFGIQYNMNLYKGCSHGCIYCDSRSQCYQIENFDMVRGKKEAIAILKQELLSKRKKGVIGIGAMSDTYNPFESKEQLTKQALEVIARQGFGVSIETKSDLIVRDIEIFKAIQKQADVILKFTITTAEDRLCKKIEPQVCPTSKRLEAMRKLANEGLFVGTLLSPILPFITDSEANIREIIRLSYEHGAKFVFSMGGVTLRENQRAYYYEQLDKLFPGLKQRYIQTYGNQYFCAPVNHNIRKIFQETCKQYGLLYKMKDIIKAYQKKEEEKQISLF